MTNSLRRSLYIAGLAVVAAALAFQGSALAAQPLPLAQGMVTDTDWPANIAVLYSQLDNPGTNATDSQNFEVAFDAYDNFLGDDFVIPAAQTWSIDLVEVDGVYFNGTGPATSVNVWIYSNSGTNFPNVAVHTALNNAYAGAAGDFSIVLAPAAVLGPGTYWLVVQANQDFSTNGEWGWTDRTVQSNQAAAWQNPGGGFATACNAWGRRHSTCNIDPGIPDQCFRLSGSILTATENGTWGKVKALFQ